MTRLIAAAWRQEPQDLPGTLLTSPRLRRVGDLVGHLTAPQQWGVDLALATVLDLE
ncbi:MAG TPA: hypothetical protein VG452_02830 [Egibacteraceae bacterium]|nr:hypothetical protein [Egibacteraceae bacterium]